MSIVLKNFYPEVPVEIDDRVLIPVSDEELAVIIEEIGDDIVAEIEANYESRELLPEEEEILATEDMDERIRLINKHYSKLFPEN